MALKIVRATQDSSASSALRLWLAGRRDEALDRLAEPTGAPVEEAIRILDGAVGESAALAARAGRAVAAWTDEQAAYRVVREVAEHAIDEVSAVGQVAWAPRGIAALEAVLPYLERIPHEPLLLDYVGVCLLGVGEAGIALKVLHAAARLDSDVENIRGNIAAARERLRARLPMAGPLRVRVADIGRRSTRIAQRARELPEAGTITLCMIVKDEEEMLPDCLASVAGCVDEMIIVDTGSSDRTVEIAEAAGARVIHFPWTGSFSEARNVGFDAVETTHILWLDADERIAAGDAVRLHDLTRRTWREGYWLVEINHTGQDEAGTAASHLALRLLRSRPAYRFTGAIHEQLRTSMPHDLGERFQLTDLRIEHLGYLKARIDEREKNKRNLELLEEELRHDPENAFTHFNVGTEHLCLHDWKRAGDHLEIALKLLRREAAFWEFSYAPLLVSRLVTARRAEGDFEKASELAASLFEHFPGLTDLVYEQAICAREQGDLDGAARLFAQCLEMGDAPARYAPTVGIGTFMALCALADVELRRGDVARAEEFFERSLREHPQYLPAGYFLAQTLLAAEDVDPDAVYARLSRFASDKLTWWLLLGTAFYERGHVALGERLFRDALRKNPAHPAARVGLIEALLSQHRYAEIEAERGDLPAATVPRLAVDRARVLAAAVLADQERAAAALADLGEAEADQDEVAFLRALATGDGVERLGIGAAPYALTYLDALAKLEEFDVFERSLPLAERAIADPREAALALGELYLQRGFYRLAADSALRACDLGQPDGRSLALLGKAACAEGHFDEALEVLDEAVRLDPRQHAAERLAEQLRRRVAA